ncbi:MAG: hypothetical protein AAF634_05030 [Bacteroidota bacterium]
MMYVDSVWSWIIVTIVFLMAVAILAYNYWLHKRWKAIERFEALCEKTIREKPTHPWPLIYQISEKRYIELELRRYRKKRPDHRKLLHSTKLLTIENWFSLEDQRHLFDRSLYETINSPTKKEVSTNKKVRR